MASDLYIFDGSSSSSSICHRSSPEMFSSDTTPTTTTTELPFLCNNTDLYPYLDVLNMITTESNSSSNNNPVDESLYIFDHLAPHLLSSSPPSHQLETLTLSQPNSAVFSNGFPNFSAFDSPDVKTELFFDGSAHNQTGAAAAAALMARSYSAVENAGKSYMQRSFSSNSVEAKPGFHFNSPFDPLVESSNNLHNQTLSHMRRVCSTGDLQSMRRELGGQRSYSSPLAMENSSSSSPLFTDEPNFKVGRYSAEERKERISKYKAKRTQRNFTKTIKYACRKTLADNRPRIRGRFARNDEVVETPKNSSSSFARDEDDDDLWNLDGLHEEEEAFVGSFVQPPQLQYTASFW